MYSKEKKDIEKKAFESLDIIESVDAYEFKQECDNIRRALKTHDYFQFSPNQKSFIDFILIISIIFGMFSIVGSICVLLGMFETSSPIYITIIDLFIVSISVIYLIYFKIKRLFYGKFKHSNKVR